MLIPIINVFEKTINIEIAAEDESVPKDIASDTETLLDGYD